MLGASVSVKSDSKAAVISAYNATRSVWIDVSILDVDRAAYDPYKDYRENSETPFVLPCLPTKNELKYIRNELNNRVRTHEREILVNPDDLPFDYKLIDKVVIAGVEFKTEMIELINEDVLIKITLRAGG